jgi:hypothetical protein
VRTLFTLGLGALAMYLLDPQQGRRRRALLQDQLTHARTGLRKRAAGTARDLSNRAHGMAAEARSAISTEGERASATPEGARHLGR